jgi:hypothetical protein
MRTTPAKGDRVRVTAPLPHDIDTVDVGADGTVTHVFDHGSWFQISVAWDNGRRLMLLYIDPYEMLGQS